MDQNEVADFNPVYPYEQPNRRVNLMPPFYSSDGFTESPTTILSLDCAEPISVETGQLGLKLGPGLSLNNQGQLQAIGGAAPQTKFPLEYEDDKLSLKYTKPLTSTLDALTLNVGDGLLINAQGQLENPFRNAYTFESPLSVNLGSQVSLKYAAPLKTNSSNSTLTLATSDYFTLDASGNLMLSNPFPPLILKDGAIQLATSAPLQTDTTSRLSLKLASPLETNTDSALALKLGAGVTLDSHSAVSLNLDGKGLYLNPQSALALRLGGGLNIDSQSALALKPGPGVYLDQNSALTLRLGAGLGIDSNSALVLKLGAGLGIDSNNSLYVTSNGNGTVIPPTNITAQAPLKLTNDTLTLSYASPLTNSNNSLGISYSNPLINSNNSLAIRIFRGLTTTINGLQVENGPGLLFKNNALSLDLGAGLKFADNYLVTNAGPGLVNIGDKIQTKLGAGLKYDSDDAITFTDPPSGYTLWTTADPSPNVNLTDERGGRIWLSLTRAGDLVLGTVAIEGLTSGSNTISYSTPRSVEIVFEDDGSLNPRVGDLRGTWGFKQGDSIDPTSPLDPLRLMPSTSIYPRGLAARSEINVPVTFNGNVHGNLRITLNTVPIYGFSIDFKWSVDQTTPIAFRSGSASFAYCPEK
ncbi:fiber [red squirrel adenovirus 1]|uniref:Fiber n=1 Tax=red squirrel adenovirus 1 TaxID=2773314 RepID=A0A240FBH1_9ADEN|nr:fiber [red squirrel adenovirus 1]ARE31902.1 fiber [red squirrel adenovirus 1]